MPELIIFSLGSFLAMAIFWDLRERRVPNWLITAMLVAGLTMQYATGDWLAVLNAIAGLTLGLLAFIPLYAAGGMGAGDVKLMAGSGVFLGAPSTALAILYTLIFGGVIAVGKVAWQRHTNEVPAPGRGIPYAPSIAAGVAASLVHIL